MNEEKSLWQSVKWPLVFVGFWWILHFLQITFDYSIGYWGVFPRKVFGLKGIIFAPLIHGDLPHLIHNSIPFLVLASMINYFYRTVAFRSFLMIYLLTGITVWLGARSVFHIGASGVVYGLMTFVLGTGIFRRNIKSVALGFVVFFFYSGMLAGVLPTKEGISWESHLYGALVGLFVSFYYKEEIEEDEIAAPEETELPENLRPFFLPPDTFDKTRAERRKELEEGNDWTSTIS